MERLRECLVQVGHDLTVDAERDAAEADPYASRLRLLLRSGLALDLFSDAEEAEIHATCRPWVGLSVRLREAIAEYRTPGLPAAPEIPGTAGAASSRLQRLPLLREGRARRLAARGVAASVNPNSDGTR